MRALLTLILLAGAVFLGLRACGYVGKHADAPANAESGNSGADSGRSGELIGEGAPSSPPAESAVPRPVLSADLLAAAKQVADGSTLGDRAVAVDKLATDANAAIAAIALRLKAATGDKPGEKWRALSTLAVEPSFDEALREQFVQRAVGMARDGVIGVSSVRYKVEKGDSLDKISRKYGKDKTANLTAGMLRWVNGITADRIKPGMELVVPTEKLRLVVSKSRFTVRVFLGDGMIRAYRCAIGREDKTPVATFEIETKLIKPPWDDPITGKRLHYAEAGYPLGTRWLSFKAAEGRSGLGIHGTDDPNSVGTKASLGCIRLKNEDVEDLFELAPVGAIVSIQA